MYRAIFLFKSKGSVEAKLEVKLGGGGGGIPNKEKSKGLAIEPE